jgi:hypothetical protein
MTGRKLRDRFFSRQLRKAFRNQARFRLLYPLMSIKNRLVRSGDINDHEFCVLSQHGEDGIIDHVFRTLDITPTSFVEFGFHPQESNCLLLLMRHRARGLFMDTRRDVCNLAARTFALLSRKVSIGCHKLCPENINRTILDHGFSGDIDLLSIDVDSIDYWLWEAMDCLTPKLVVIETSPWLGQHRAVTMPMSKAALDRLDPVVPHNIVCGASPPALLALGERKGYVCLGADSSGINMFFLRKDLFTSKRFVVAEVKPVQDQSGRVTLTDVEIDALVGLGQLQVVA